MHLVKSPTLTLAKLAANRSNARRSTGPRTAAGKRRIVLNALKHGRFSGSFGENLIKAGADAELFDWIRGRVFDGFRPLGHAERWQAEGLAREVWCRAYAAYRASRAGRARGHGQGGLDGILPARRGTKTRIPFRPSSNAPAKASIWCLAWTPWRLGGLETKPRYALLSTDSSVTFPSRIRIDDPRNGRRLAFWVRRRRGTVPPRIPVTAIPEVAARLLGQQAALLAAPSG